MSKTGAAFSVRFLRNGDQVVAVRDIINQSGDGVALFQVVDPVSGTVSPNWDATGKTGTEKTAIENAQPIIRLGVRSSAGFPAEITSVTWAYDGTNLSFTMNGNAWVTASNNSKFQARINNGYWELRIVGNLASLSSAANKQISYEISYLSNAMSDSIQGSVDVLVQMAGEDSHILQITTNRVELDAAHTSATLTAVGQYGTNPVTIGSNGYTIEWYQDGALLTGQTASTLTVTRDMVTGGSLFVAKLKLNGSAVAQDSQRISDIADEYQISYTPSNAGSNYCGVNHNAVYTLSLTKNGSTYSGSVQYSWKVYNAAGVLMKADGTGATVTVTPANCLVDSTYYADADVQVTAEF